MFIDEKHDIYAKTCSMNMDISAAAYTELDNTWQYPTQARYQYSRLYFILDGEAEIYVNNEKTVLTGGNIYFVPANTLFAYSCKNKLNKIYFHINITLFDKSDFFQQLDRCITLHHRNDVIRQVHELYKKSEATDILKIRSIIYDLLWEIAHTMNISVQNNFSPLVTEILEYIDLHYLEHPTEKNIANALYISEDKLRKAFKKEMNISVGRFIDDILLSAAEKELRTTNVTINEISHRYGYCDQFYFSRMFTKKYGISPSKYRKALEV